MPYTHFGKQADVFKHVILCEVLKREKPDLYVETNSACAEYMLSNSLEQQYGICHFLNNVSEYNEFTDSNYLNLERKAYRDHLYLGSPGLAMNILNSPSNELLFFDIEKEPLKNIEAFAQRDGFRNRIRTFNQDSIRGMMELLPSLPVSSFIHIDPYEINKSGEPGGFTYFDVFLEAAQAGIKCYLWYGFMTLSVKEQLNAYILNGLRKNKIKGCACVELILEIIERNTIPCNPGILGSGILTANLSKDSNTILQDYSNLLVNMYQGAIYNGTNGTLYKEVIL